MVVAQAALHLALEAAITATTAVMAVAIPEAAMITAVTAATTTNDESLMVNEDEERHLEKDCSDRDNDPDSH